MVRIRRLRYTLEPLRMEEALHDPYRVKVLRKVFIANSIFQQMYTTCTCILLTTFISNLLQVIDGCAFRVYGHWVKKGEGQNRAALFENTPRTELHAIYVANLSR